MRAPFKSALKEILRKSLSGPETRILWNPLRNEDFGMVSNHSFLSVRAADFSLKKVGKSRQLQEEHILIPRSFDPNEAAYGS